MKRPENDVRIFRPPSKTRQPSPNRGLVDSRMARERNVLNRVVVEQQQTLKELVSFSFIYELKVHLSNYFNKPLWLPNSSDFISAEDPTLKLRLKCNLNVH